MEKLKKLQAYTLLSLAGPDADQKFKAFVYDEGVDKEDPKVFYEKVSAVMFAHKKNVILDRHAFNTICQKAVWVHSVIHFQSENAQKKNVISSK